ncbi:MAG: glutamate racemase [Endomicrobiia bacterium]
MKEVEMINSKYNNFPIGIFDSGLGGLTVVKEIINLLPNENIVYLGDTARVPYGTKSKDTIIKYSIENTKFLLQKNIKILVVACNTASSYAIPTLKKMLKKIPVVGVVVPGSKNAYENTKNYKIGIIGTTATIKSESYKKSILNFAKKQNCKKTVKIYSQACPLFVPLIEEGWMDKIYQEKYYKKKLKKNLKEEFEYRMINHENILRYVASEYLLPIKQKKIDTLDRRGTGVDYR